MTHTNSFAPQLSSDAEKRRVLAKVYSLLIRLAEEAEKGAPQEITNAQKERSNDLESGSENAPTA